MITSISTSDKVSPLEGIFCAVKSTNMKTRTEILQLLKHYKPTAQKKYGMTKNSIC